MKNFKKLTVVLVLVGILASTGIAFAATIKTPAEIVSALTGKTVSEVTQQRASGKTYGTIANDAGKLAEFKAQMLESKKAILDQKVKDGIMTQQQADQIYNAIKNNQATCDGTGNAAIGRKNGAGFGMGMGAGIGRGNGQGKGLRGCSGSCINQ